MTAGTPQLSRTGAILWGWVVVAAAHGGAIASRFGRHSKLSARILSELYAAGYALALAAASVGVATAWARWGPRRRGAAHAALALAGAIGGAFLLEIDASGVAGRASEAAGLPYAVLVYAFAAAGGTAVALGFGLGRLLARRWLRLASVPAAAAVAWFNGTELAMSYEGLHLYAAVFAATLAAAALTGARLPGPAGRLPRRTGLVATFAAAALGAPALLVPPPNRVLVELSRQPGAILAPYPLFPQDEVDAAWEPPPERAAWFADRAPLPPIPPTRGRLLADDAVVLLIGVDSLRADVLENDAHVAKLPFLSRLRSDAAYFTLARSPGTSTAPALAAIFSGKYYSQQYWVPHPKRPFEPFPHEDESVRFPAVLADAGIPTVAFDATGWLTNGFGVVGGFTEETRLRPPKSGYPRASVAVDRILERLDRHESGSIFLFAHLLDAHSPYTSVKRDVGPFEGYLAELGFVDAELRRLRQGLVKRKLWERTCLVVYSDHGEAFGEHGLTFHGHSLYEVLLRVPLFVRLPGRRGVRIDAPVSLVDVGPTLLDLFGLEIPASFMGQSLVPLVLGERSSLDRPIVAEARLKRAMILPDGTKVIHDTRMRTVEVYDLARDPDEDDNLYDRDDPTSVERFAAVDRFFRAHTLSRPGYRVPYRKW